LAPATWMPDDAIAACRGRGRRCVWVSLWNWKVCSGAESGCRWVGSSLVKLSWIQLVEKITVMSKVGYFFVYLEVWNEKSILLCVLSIIFLKLKF
jgi:hypothetical protein